MLGGLIWGAGYCLLGYLAGSAYAVVERRVGTGLAIAIGVIVVAAWQSGHSAGTNPRRAQARSSRHGRVGPVAGAANLGRAAGYQRQSAHGRGHGRAARQDVGAAAGQRRKHCTHAGRLLGVHRADAQVRRDAEV